MGPRLLLERGLIGEQLLCQRPGPTSLIEGDEHVRGRVWPDNKSKSVTITDRAVLCAVMRNDVRRTDSGGIAIGLVGDDIAGSGFVPRGGLSARAGRPHQVQDWAEVD